MPQTNISHISQQPFTISDQELEFLQRIGIPLPTISPEERFRHLMAFRNEWKLYKRKCDATGEDIISAYPTDSHFTVYKNAYWWGDQWDPMQYGRNFDFTRPFFEQFAELQKAVPREGTSVFNSENCDYNSHWRMSRNCYLSSLGAKCEDVYYSYWVANAKDIYDSGYINDSSFCSYSMDLKNCYNSVCISECNDSRDCSFSYQLQSCDNCMFSSNLVRKSYHIFNKPVSKEEFETFKTKIFDGSWKTWQQAHQDFLKIKSEAIQRNLHTLKCENCNGDHIYNSKNCNYCFDTHDSEDCENSISAVGKNIHSSYSAGWTSCEMVYYSLASRGCTNIAFCNYSWFSANLLYCDSCVSCQDCFGCIGLRQKKFCIFNKQYTEEEYRELLPKIIEHMKKTGEFGEFFPPYLSPYGYNESAAQDFFPLSEEEAKQLGFQWRPEDEKYYLPATLKEIPDNIHAVTDAICREILACEKCRKNYKIVPQEWKFYKINSIPIPRWCSSCRHQARMNLRNPPYLWERSCAKCNQKMHTSFRPESQETIYCEDCFRQEVF